jgi:hypothetical protein
MADAQTTELERLRAEAALLRQACAALVEVAEKTFQGSWQPMRYELQQGKRALKSSAGEKALMLIEAARELRDSAMRSGMDETGAPKLKALIATVDELDVF